MLHYFIAANLYRVFIHREEERIGDQLDETSEAEVPRWLDRPSFTLFWLKTLFLLASFSMLLVEFYYRLRGIH